MHFVLIAGLVIWCSGCMKPVMTHSPYACNLTVASIYRRGCALYCVNISHSLRINIRKCCAEAMLHGIRLSKCAKVDLAITAVDVFSFTKCTLSCSVNHAGTWYVLAAGSALMDHQSATM